MRFLTCVATASLLSPTVLAAQAPANEQPELWRGLRAGMSGEDASAVLRALPGVDGVTVKQDKRGRTTLQIKTSRSFSVAEQRATVVAEFSGQELSAVNVLIWGNGMLGQPCADEVGAMHAVIDNLLSKKYIKISSTNSVSQFKNDSTAVRVSEELRGSFGQFDFATNACVKRGVNQSGHLKLHYMPLNVLNGEQLQDERRVERAVDDL